MTLIYDLTYLSYIGYGGGKKILCPIMQGKYGIDEW